MCPDGLMTEFLAFTRFFIFRDYHEKISMWTKLALMSLRLPAFYRPGGSDDISIRRDSVQFRMIAAMYRAHRN